MSKSFKPLGYGADVWAAGLAADGRGGASGALEELVPPAIKSLKAHLGDGDPDAWRAALRVFEHAFGRAPEQLVEGLVVPESAAEVTSLSWVQLQLLAAKLAAEVPAGETDYGTIANGSGVAVRDDGLVQLAVAAGGNDDGV